MVDAVSLQHVQGALVEVVRRLRTTDGRDPAMGTIDPKALRTAAIVAIQIAASQTVIPDDEKITIRTTRQTAGPFELV